MTRSNQFDGLLSPAGARDLEDIHRKIGEIGYGKRSMDEFRDLIDRAAEIIATDEVLATNPRLRAKMLAATARARSGVGPPLPRRQARTR